MIAEGWSIYKLSDLIDLIGGGTPKTNVPEYWNGNIPWLSVVDFGNSTKHVYNTEKKITQRGLLESSTKLLKKGYLIISARGTVGELAVLGDDMAFNQSCYGINSKDKTINDYIYYLIKHNVSQIRRKTHGAVFDTITRLTFENIEVQIPTNLDEQSRIASILSSLDDKIELNLQMNKTLESIVQAIFKEWFVDFRFPGFDGELTNALPKGWRRGPLKELVEVKNGFAFKGTDFIEAGIPVIKIKNVKPNKILLNTLSYVSREVADKAQRYRVNRDDLLITMSGNRIDGTPDTWVGKVALFNRDGEFLLNQRVSILRIINPKQSSKYYLVQLLSSTEFQYYFITNGTSSGGQANISPDLIYKTDIIIPSPDVLRRYDEVVGALFNKIFLNDSEIETLSLIRDLLLPKLMTGKIKVA